VRRPSFLAHALPCPPDPPPGRPPGRGGRPLGWCCGARSLPNRRPAPPPAPARQTGARNLPGIPSGLVSGEYERAIGREGFAFGVGGTAAFDVDNTGDLFYDDSGTHRYLSLQAKLKYYPSARGLRGFAVGVTVGGVPQRAVGSRLVRLDTVRIPGGSFPPPVFEPTRRTINNPTVGTVLDYNLFIGPRQRFLVGLGVGARRVLGVTRDRTRIEGHDGLGYGAEYGPRSDRALFDGRLHVGSGF
jgi:hypothetical protein